MFFEIDASSVHSYFPQRATCEFKNAWHFKEVSEEISVTIELTTTSVSDILFHNRIKPVTN